MNQGIKILIIEDDRASLLYLGKVLQEYGPVEFCESGTVAIESFKKAFEEDDPFQVLFIDILLPELDGFHIVQYVRKWEQEHASDYSPVLIMESSCAFTDDILKAFASGVNLYLTKPYYRKQIDGFMDECGFKKLEEA